MRERKNKKQMKKTEERGITLIALVITIIILIILATVTLNVVLGEDGLIQRAQEAKDMTEEAAKEEQDSLNKLMDELENVIGDEELDKFSRAERNLGDAISLVQTAEGAVTSSSEVLNSINILILQSINGTNSPEDIQSMILEINALLDEIDRIANETIFAGHKIIDGSLSGDNAYKVDIVTRELSLEIDGVKRIDLGLDNIGDLTTEEGRLNLQEEVIQALQQVNSIRSTLGAKHDLYENLKVYYSSSKDIISQNMSEDETKDELAANGMQQIISMLEKVKSIENQVSSGGITEDDKEALLIEINETINGIDIIAEDLEFKGQKLLNGSYKDIPNLNSIGLSQDGTKFYVDLSTQENITKSITECENAITKIEGLLNNN